MEQEQNISEQFRLKLAKWENEENEHCKKRKEIADHSRRVADICELIAKKLSITDPTIEIDIELLKSAAYMHDVGKRDGNNDNHHIRSAEYVLNMMGRIDNNKYLDKLCSIIVAHKDQFAPIIDVALEAAILRIADKIDKYNKLSVIRWSILAFDTDIEKYEMIDVKYYKSLRKIRRYYISKGLYNKCSFKKFKRVCRDIKRNKRMKNISSALNSNLNALTKSG